eukprot:Nitzschia sp. Nitz4//scaffold69_size99277//90883//92850//NITZ4_004650-RA/size99277-processed-gene-0.90-mRNA-1//-1//CDS//3329556766//5512//frame0
MLKSKKAHHTPPRNWNLSLESAKRGVVNPTELLERNFSTEANPLPIEGEILKTNIEVCARIRPLQIQSSRKGYFTQSRGIQPPSSTSHQQNSSSANQVPAWDVSADGETAAQSSSTNLVQGRTHSYTLDHVYGPESSTTQIYQRSVQTLVHRAMQGYHSTVLAYGQTSTGKTFTMTGAKDAPGLIPLSIADCFRYVRNSQESREYLIRISYLEVYKEHIRDLLNATPEPVRLFDGPNGLVIRGLKEEVVSSPEQVYAILAKGEKRRQIGATHMNQHSSRSHVMVRLWIESTSVGSTTTHLSSLSLVDLAGSESVRLNGADRREEGQYINKSLMTLGQVVLSLSEGKSVHIPYRDSKLTRLLQPSLSGNAQMVLLCCVSPQANHLEESHNTFKFATRAKKVEQKAIINVAQDEQSMLQNYKSEIEDLRKQLAEAKEQQRIYQEKVKHAGEEQKANTDGEIQELAEAIQTMERLVLRSRPHQHRASSSENVSNENMELLEEVNESSDDDDDMLIDLPPRSSPKSPEHDALHNELDRIRGLLGSVMKKRGVSVDGVAPAARRLDFSTAATTPQKQEEVESLRKQLEEQETVTNIRKADSSFLQSQLREKDNLLEEVSKVLEALEKRQTKLEQDNAALLAELRWYREKHGESRRPFQPL